MPELPEVETVCRGLNEIIKPNSAPAKITEIKSFRKDIRKPIPNKQLKKIDQQNIQSIERRAKFLIFKTEKGSLLSHLGMTGSWRKEPLKYKPKTHDHFRFQVNKKFFLVYNDPRRFGVIDFIDIEGFSPWLDHLGPEPLDTKNFTAKYLKEKLKKRKSPIKNLIMDQKIVVGVGNIYASEALFQSGIRPQKLGYLVSEEKLNLLVKAIRKVLKQAIKAGGSTIKDFKQAGGSEGYFQNKLFVYGKENSHCLICKTPIKVATLGGRSTYWCHKCQK